MNKCGAISATLAITFQFQQMKEWYFSEIVTKTYFSMVKEPILISKLSNKALLNEGFIRFLEITVPYLLKEGMFRIKDDISVMFGEIVRSRIVMLILSQFRNSGLFPL